MGISPEFVLAASTNDSNWGGTLLCIGVIGLFVAISIIVAQAEAKAEQEKINKMSPQDREAYLAEKQLTFQWGPVNPAMVCPHCQTKGLIRTKRVVQKKGISGSKATAAVITGGLSVLGTGLSRKEEATQAYCGGCNNSWLF